MAWRRRHMAAAGLVLGVGVIGQAIGAAADAPPPSHALGVHYFAPNGGKPPGGGGTSPLYFHVTGAPVTVTPHIYLSFWGTDWTSNAEEEAAQSYVSGFFRAVGGSSWLATTTQYCQNVPGGTVSCSAANDPIYINNISGQLAGVYNDQTTVPAHPQSADIVAAAQRLVGQFTFDANALYMVLTPSGKSQRGFGTSFCAYHEAATIPQGTMAVAYVPYQPDSALCNDNGVLGANGGFTISAGHEYAEAQTDPVPSSGWLDKHGAEIGDKCETILASIDLKGTSYAVQDLWSNAAGGCVLLTSGSGPVGGSSLPAS